MPTVIFAADNFGGALGKVSNVAGNDGAGYDTTDNINNIIGTGITAALSFVGILFLILMIFGGYEWMTASGKEEKVERAKKIIQAAIIGLIVIAMAAGISYFVVNNLL